MASPNVCCVYGHPLAATLSELVLISKRRQWLLAFPPSSVGEMALNISFALKISSTSTKVEGSRDVVCAFCANNNRESTVVGHLVNGVLILDPRTISIFGDSPLTSQGDLEQLDLKNSGESNPTIAWLQGQNLKVYRTEGSYRFGYYYRCENAFDPVEGKLVSVDGVVKQVSRLAEIFIAPQRSGQLKRCFNQLCGLAVRARTLAAIRIMQNNPNTRLEDARSEATELILEVLVPVFFPESQVFNQRQRELLRTSLSQLFMSGFTHFIFTLLLRFVSGSSASHLKSRIREDICSLFPQHLAREHARGISNEDPDARQRLLVALFDASSVVSHLLHKPYTVAVGCKDNLLGVTKPHKRSQGANHEVLQQLADEGFDIMLHLYHRAVVECMTTNSRPGYLFLSIAMHIPSRKFVAYAFNLRNVSTVDGTRHAQKVLVDLITDVVKSAMGSSLRKPRKLSDFLILSNVEHSYAAINYLTRMGVKHMGFLLRNPDRMCEMSHMLALQDALSRASLDEELVQMYEPSAKRHVEVCREIEFAFLRNKMRHFVLTLGSASGLRFCDWLSQTVAVEGEECVSRYTRDFVAAHVCPQNGLACHVLSNGFPTSFVCILKLTIPPVSTSGGSLGQLSFEDEVLVAIPPEYQSSPDLLTRQPPTVFSLGTASASPTPATSSVLAQKFVSLMAPYAAHLTATHRGRELWPLVLGNGVSGGFSSIERYIPQQILDGGSRLRSLSREQVLELLTLRIVAGSPFDRKTSKRLDDQVTEKLMDVGCRDIIAALKITFSAKRSSQTYPGHNICAVAVDIITGRIVGRSFNTNTGDLHLCRHAETKLSNGLKASGWPMSRIFVVSSLEPCHMCSTYMSKLHISHICYLQSDPCQVGALSMSAALIGLNLYRPALSTTRPWLKDAQHGVEREFSSWCEKYCKARAVASQSTCDALMLEAQREVTDFLGDAESFLCWLAQTTEKYGLEVEPKPLQASAIDTPYDERRMSWALPFAAVATAEPVMTADEQLALCVEEFSALKQLTADFTNEDEDDDAEEEPDETADGDEAEPV